MLPLLAVTALGTSLCIDPAFAAGPSVATVVDSVGGTLATSSNNADDGVVIVGDVNGISVNVFDPINSSVYGVFALENGTGDVSVSVDASVSSNSDVGLFALGAGVTVTGGGNISSAGRYGIYAHSSNGDTLVSGTGKTTSTDSLAIYTYTDSGVGDTTITRSGAISGVGSAIYSMLDHSATNTDSLSITDIGAASASGVASKTIYMNNNTLGSTTLNTSNEIVNTGTGTTYGLYVTSERGATDITVGDITMNAASEGRAILISNSANSTNGTSVTINGTIDTGAGTAPMGVHAVMNSAVGMDLTISSTAVINGAIQVSGSDINSSTLKNRGVWNTYGLSNSFSGDLINSGTLNLQGNSALDTVSVLGDITLLATSLIKVDVDISSIYNVNTIYGYGDIVLDGALEVNAIGDKALYSAANARYHILFRNNGSGTASGSFVTVTDNLANLYLDVYIVGGDVYYKFVVSAIDFKSYSNGNNQGGAATAMDAFDYSSTEGQTLETEFLALTNDEAKDAIKQIGGGDHQGASQSGAGTSSGFHNAMMGGANGGTTGGANGGGNSEPAVTGYTVSATGDVPSIGTAIWARALGGYSKLDKGTTAADLITATYGVVGGVEYYVADDTTLGLSAGYTRANFSVQTTGSSSYADNFHFGASAHLGASSAFDTGFGLSAGVDATQHNYHTKRNIVIGTVTSTATSDYSGVTIGGTVTARYGMDIGDNIILSTFAGLDASHTRNSAFAETGAGLLNISTDASSSKKLGSTIGLGIANKVGDISTAISAAWRHEYGDVNHTTTNTLAGSPTSYTSTTPTEARNKIMLNASATLPLSDNSSLTFAAFGDLSRTSVNVGASAGYKLNF